MVGIVVRAIWYILTVPIVTDGVCRSSRGDEGGDKQGFEEIYHGVTPNVDVID